MKSPITMTVALHLLRLFDYCFKQGVVDAYDLEDDYTSREWLDERKADGQYGLLSDIDAQYDWRRWRFTLMRWSRNAGLRSLGENFIDGIRDQKDFTCSVFAVSRRFYLMGIEEWLEYPQRLGMELFKQNLKVHWKPMKLKSEQVFTKHDYIVLVQQMAYEALDAGDDPKFLDSFAQALWCGLRR